MNTLDTCSMAKSIFRLLLIPDIVNIEYNRPTEELDLAKNTNKFFAVSRDKQSH